MRNVNYNAATAANITAGVTGAAIDAKNIFAVSCHAVFTGSSPTGTLKFQCSNEQPKPGGPTNWIDIPSQTVAIGATGSFLIPKFEVSYAYLRVVFIFTSGTGTATINVKTLGG